MNIDAIKLYKELPSGEKTAVRELVCAYLKWKKDRFYRTLSGRYPFSEAKKIVLIQAIKFPEVLRQKNTTPLNALNRFIMPNVSQNSLKLTFTALNSFISGHQPGMIGWTPEFITQCKKDIQYLESMYKQISYYGGIESLIKYAEIGSKSIPLFPETGSEQEVVNS